MPIFTDFAMQGHLILGYGVVDLAQVPKCVRKGDGAGNRGEPGLDRKKINYSEAEMSENQLAHRSLSAPLFLRCDHRLSRKNMDIG